LFFRSSFVRSVVCSFVVPYCSQGDRFTYRKRSRSHSPPAADFPKAERANRERASALLAGQVCRR